LAVAVVASAIAVAVVVAAFAARYSEASASRLNHRREAASALPKAGGKLEERND
jgi:hypothetical protein